MFRSIFMKGLVAILIEMLMARVSKRLKILSFSPYRKRWTKNNFIETARIIFTKGITDAERMAHEMEDVIETLLFNLPAVMTQTVPKKLVECNRLGLQEQFGGTIQVTLEQALHALEESSARIQQEAPG